MRDLVFAIALFASNVYFCVAAIFGYSVVDDVASTDSYKYYCIGIFALSIFSYIKEELKRKSSSRHFLSLCVFAIFIVTGIFSGYANDSSVLILGAFCLPAGCIAVYYAERRNLSDLVKWIDILLLVMTLSLVFSLRQLFVNISEGITSYSQSLSYNAAYCFVLYLFFLLFGNKYVRFSFFRSKIYKIFSFIMLPYTLIILFFSGGRGALGTIIAGCLVLIYLYRKHFKTSKARVLRLTFALALLLPVAFTMVPQTYQDIFNNNFDRVFSFFDTDKSMYERASGRDVVLKVAFEQIEESPILGSGLFSYKSNFNAKAEVPYPHNIFVEILLQGGILYLFVFLIIICRAFLKLKHIFKWPRQELLVVFIVYSMTMLLYSGSYMQNSFFWFFMTYIFNFNKRYQRNDKSNSIYIYNVP